MPVHPLSPGAQTLAVLDTCVMLPPRMSDILFDLYLEGLYQPRWTEDIEQEFLRNWAAVAARQANLSGVDVEETNRKAEQRLHAFRRATRGSHHIFGAGTEDVLSRVPVAVDRNDRHVIAAAICLLDEIEAYAAEDDSSSGSAHQVYVVTSNLRHMAPAACRELAIEVIHPAEFIESLHAAASERVMTAMRRVTASLRKPPYTLAELAEVLEEWGATSTAHSLASIARA